MEVIIIVGFLVFFVVVFMLGTTKFAEAEVAVSSIKIVVDNNLGRTYNVIGIVEGRADESELLAQANMVEQAKKLGADAIIYYNRQIVADTSGSVKTTNFLGNKEISGKTSTVTTFYVQGTAVKYCSEEEVTLQNFDEEQYYEKLLKFEKLFEKKLITEDEYEEKISALKKQKKQVDQLQKAIADAEKARLEEANRLLGEEEYVSLLEQLDIAYKNKEISYTEYNEKRESFKRRRLKN